MLIWLIALLLAVNFVLIVRVWRLETHVDELSGPAFDAFAAAHNLRSTANGE